VVPDDRKRTLRCVEGVPEPPGNTHPRCVGAGGKLDRDLEPAAIQRIGLVDGLLDCQERPAGRVDEARVGI
jgi:hypothetical protein